MAKKTGRAKQELVTVKLLCLDEYVRPDRRLAGLADIVVVGGDVVKSRYWIPSSVVCERDGSWWVASMLGIPGAYGQGKTRMAAYENMLSAIRDIIDVHLDEARGGRPRHRRRRP